MRYVRVGQVKSVQDTDGHLIKVNRVIHESKRVNVMFNILHIGRNGSITLLRAGKILVIEHDPSSQRRGIFLLKSSPCSPRSGGGRDKLRYGGRDESNNYI